MTPIKRLCGVFGLVLSLDVVSSTTASAQTWQRIAVDGVELEYRIVGQGEPIVLACFDLGDGGGAGGIGTALRTTSPLRR